VSQAVEFHAALQRAGTSCDLKIYPGRGHSELLFSALTEKRPQIVTDISEFVRNGQVLT
jgi:acetyl esterase/lipase